MTAVAVLLSIRRESLFIAVLGLLGGFATPALLSTGENRPIPLFAYLLLLNVGLAWVAYAKQLAGADRADAGSDDDLPVGLGLQVPERQQLSLAMGIFLLFPLAAFVGLIAGRARARRLGHGRRRRSSGRRSSSAAMPLLFAFYLAAVPGYGARPGCSSGSCFSSTRACWRSRSRASRSPARRRRRRRRWS